MGIRTSVKNALRRSLGRSPSAPPTQPGRAPAPFQSEREPELEPELPRGDASAADYIGAVVSDNPVVLFMKGEPGAPQCGFSATASRILAFYEVPFAHVDVLLDPEVRAEIKVVSSWPTIPQIYIGGEFVGGSDILMQLHESGELQGLLEAVSS
jgi:monothiol glutaredoxin